MADVKWIKIATDIFDDEKILIIEKLPNADSIIVIWFKLLTLAGKQNNSGVFIMNNRIAYTDEMLAAIFRRDLNLVKMALSTFENYGMVEIIEGALTIPNWSKHQSLDKLSSRAEYQKKYMQEYRKKQKLLASGNNSKTNCKPNSKQEKTSVSEIEEEREEELEVEEDKQEEVINMDVKKSMVTCFEKCVGRMIKPIQLDTLISYVDDVEFQLIEYVLIYSSSKQDPYQYAKKVIETCITNGIHTVDQFKLSIDERKKAIQKSNEKGMMPAKVEKFNTMYSHDWDFDEIERLERAYIDRMLAGDKDE